MTQGLTLGLVQLLFALTWTVYVVFLPALAESAGIARSWVVWILVADQAIFIVMDFALGIAADRVVAGVRKLGGWIAAVNTVSCLAFIAIPQVAAGGPAMSALMLASVLVWSATASVLRAPIFVLLSRHAQPSQATWLANLALLGLGLAGAVSTMLTAKLRGIDPRLPFALAGAGLFVAVAALGWHERRLGGVSAGAAPVAAPPRKPPGAAFFLAVALLALGFQVHTSINSAPAYLRFASPPMLESLMPVFWVGFNLLIMPVAWLIHRASAAAVLTVGAVVGAASLAWMGVAPNLTMLTVAQLAAGAGWALVIGSAVNAAIEAGRSGREGRFSGSVFALLALGALLRLSLVAAELHKSAEFARLLQWLPAVCWAAAVALCLAWMVRDKRGAPAAARA